jgi:fatty-acyl-CoA synthase
MRLIDYLDKGAALGPAAPCLTMGERDMSYADVQRVTWRVARALQRAGVKPGDSGDPVKQ